MPSPTEENYLKAIYKLAEKIADASFVNNNAIAGEMGTSAASVTDMLKRLAKKGLIKYQSHKGAKLTDIGRQNAMNLVRKHRLWEVFLVNTLHFTWDEVHEIAEQLEHIQSRELTRRLANFLGNPKYDPHGDPIPDEKGHIQPQNKHLLADIAINEIGVIVGVEDHSPTFLRYLDELKLGLGAKVQICKRFEYDQSLQLLIDETHQTTISHQVSKNLYVKKMD